MGNLLVVLVTAAGVQDRDAGRDLLWRLRAAYRTISLVWADGGYAGRLVVWAKATLRLTLQIVKRTDKLAGFYVLPAVGWSSARSRGSPATGAPPDSGRPDPAVEGRPGDGWPSLRP